MGAERARADGVLGHLARLPRPVAFALGLLGIAIVEIGDIVTGQEAAFTLLYLGPIALVTWVVGLRPGLALSALSALAWLVADRANRPHLNPTWRCWNVAVEAAVFFVVTFLLAALRQRLESEKALARTDPLTQAANRRCFLEVAGQELERARRYPRPLTVAYIDVDDFKLVNDRFGHDAGDALLANTAATLRNHMRAFDMVARLGGDEFALLLPETSGPKAEALLQRIREELSEVTRKKGWPVTFSVGAVTFEAAPRSVEEMLSRADRLMYAAKAEGKTTSGKSPARPHSHCPHRGLGSR